MRELQTADWAIDYDENLTFEMLRERFFPEFPKSIFYTRKQMSKDRTSWCSRLGTFSLRQKLFLIHGSMEFREDSDSPSWILRLKAGEYGEVPSGNYQFRFPNDEETMCYKVIERPPHTSPLWKNAIRVKTKSTEPS